MTTRSRAVRVGVIGATGVSVLGVAVGACAFVPVIPKEPASSVQARATTTADPLAAVDAEVVGAWRAAEDAFFRAEAEPDGAHSAELEAAFTQPELAIVQQNLALQELAGTVGRGTWQLGSPTVVSVGPTESAPTKATVVSCIHDTQLLVDRATGVPVPGVLGTPDWAAATSQMVRTAGTWKVASQGFLIEQDKGSVCTPG